MADSLCHSGGDKDCHQGGDEVGWSLIKQLPSPAVSLHRKRVHILLFICTTAPIHQLSLALGRSGRFVTLSSIYGGGGEGEG